MTKIERLIQKLLPYSWVVIVVFVVLTCLSFSRAANLGKSISTKLDDLLPPHYPSVKIGQMVKDKFEKEKKSGNLIVIVSSSNPDQNLKAFKALVDYLNQIPEIGEVQSTKPGYEFFANHKLMFLELEDLQKIEDRLNRKIQQEKLGALYINFEGVETGQPQVGEENLDFDDLFEKYKAEYISGVKSPYYTNADDTVYYAKVYPKSKDSSLKYYKKFHHIVQSELDNFPLKKYGDNLEISMAGSIMTRLNEYNSLIEDLSRASIISFISIFLILVLFFRRLIAVILIFIPLAIGIIFGFAICSLFIENLNIITSFLFSILMGLGVDLGIHMLDRYLEDRESGLGIVKSIYNILIKTGRSSATSVFTTVAAFFILVANDFRGFSEFGWIAGIGLLAILCTYLLLFPPLLVFAEKIKVLKFGSARADFTKKYINRWPKFPFPRKISAICLIILVASLVLVPFVKFEWDYGVLRFQVAETMAARAKMREVNGRVNNPAAIVVQTEEEARAIKEELKRRKRTDNKTPTIDFYKSSYDLYPDKQDEKMAILKKINLLLQDDALNIVKGEKRKMLDDFREAVRSTKKVKLSEIPESLRQNFHSSVDEDKDQVSFVFPLPKLELDNGRNAIEFSKDVQEINVNNKTFYAVSDSIVFADVLTTMFKDSRQAILLCLIVLFLLIYLDFRNLRKTLIVFGILLFGIMSMMAVVVLLGLKFNFFNMITIPVVLGMGEDNSVHLFHRYEELKRTSIMKALFTSGTAASLASLTTMFGYLGLVFAHHPGLKSIGEFAIIGMGTCMIGSLVFLPAILVTLYKEQPYSFSPTK